MSRLDDDYMEDFSVVDEDGNEVPLNVLGMGHLGLTDYPDLIARLGGNQDFIVVGESEILGIEEDEFDIFMIDSDNQALTSIEEDADWAFIANEWIAAGEDGSEDDDS